MKLAVCRRCRHRLFTVCYEPKYCRECNSPDLEQYSFYEWFVLAAVAALTIRFL